MFLKKWKNKIKFWKLSENLPLNNCKKYLTSKISILKKGKNEFLKIFRKSSFKLL